MSDVCVCVCPVAAPVRSFPSKKEWHVRSLRSICYCVTLSCLYRAHCAVHHWPIVSTQAAFVLMCTYIYTYIYIHTYFHTHIYIYIYCLYMCVTLFVCLWVWVCSGWVWFCMRLSMLHCKYTVESVGRLAVQGARQCGDLNANKKFCSWHDSKLSCEKGKNCCSPDLSSILKARKFSKQICISKLLHVFLFYCRLQASLVCLVCISVCVCVCV